jgi:CBS domain-containing protein
MNATSNPVSKDSSVVIATAERSLRHIAELLARHRIGCVVIVENEDKVCGIVSEHDVMRAVGKAGQQALSRPVSDFMTTAVVTANKTDTNQRLLAHRLATWSESILRMLKPTRMRCEITSASRSRESPRF